MKVGINGFGRIGRAIFRAFMLTADRDVRVVAVNDLRDCQMLAHLLRHDTVHGRWGYEVSSAPGGFCVNGNPVAVTRYDTPVDIDWAAFDVDVVVEATGAFASRDEASGHLDRGVATVIVTAPVPDTDATVLFGINHHDWSVDTQNIISAGSCTAHAVAPLVTTLRDVFGWRHGRLTTVHPTTPDQSSSNDWRLARESLAGVIPKSTSAVDVIGRVIPDVSDSFDGLAYRIPTLTPGAVDLVVEVERRTDAESVVNAFYDAARSFPPGVLSVSNEPLVGSDFIGDAHSVTVDASLVTVTSGTLVHVTGWYDNETGYANRIVDLLKHVSNIQQSTINSQRSRVG